MRRGPDLGLVRNTESGGVYDVPPGAKNDIENYTSTHGPVYTEDQAREISELIRLESAKRISKPMPLGAMSLHVMPLDEMRLANYEPVKLYSGTTLVGYVLMGDVNGRSYTFELMPSPDGTKELVAMELDTKSMSKLRGDVGEHRDAETKRDEKISRGEREEFKREKIASFLKANGLKEGDRRITIEKLPTVRSYASLDSESTDAEAPTPTKQRKQKISPKYSAKQSLGI
jgi:hypothetical protein